MIAGGLVGTETMCILCRHDGGLSSALCLYTARAYDKEGYEPEVLLALLPG